jgi:hypothetical protein
MTSDVDTRDKLIDRLCAGQSTAVAEAVRMAFEHNDVPTLIAPENVAINKTFEYGFPTTLGADYTFTGWTVTGGTRGKDWQANDLTSNPIAITFKEYGNYTIAANFRLPDGTTYSPSEMAVVHVPSDLNILGPGLHDTNPSLNREYCYYIKSPLPTGFKFERWEVYGNDYKIKSNSDPLKLNITFTKRGLFDISTIFKTPNGKQHISKITEFVPEPPDILMSRSFGEETIIEVWNPDDLTQQYEWEIYEYASYSARVHRILTDSPKLNFVMNNSTDIAYIRCRAIYNNPYVRYRYSAWCQDLPITIYQQRI